MSERKGFDVENPALDFGIEDTESLDSSDVDSFLFGANPDDVNPNSPEKKEETTQQNKKESPTSTTSPKIKSEKKEESQDEEKSELETEDFFEEVTEEEKKEEEESTKQTEESKTEEEDNLFQTYTEALVEMGIFSLDEGEEAINIATPQEFKERWEHERVKDAYNMLDKVIGRFGEKHQNFIVAAINGVDPDKYYEAYSNIQNLSALDITKEDHQKIIFREALKRQGLSSERIEKKLQKAVELGELEDDTKDYYEILMEQDQEKLDNLEKQEAANLQRKEQEKRMYDNGVRTILINKLKEKEFDGIPINDKVVKEVYDFLTTEKYRLKDTGELITEFDKFFLELKRPENFEKRVKIALLAQANLNLEGIKKIAVSKETNGLFDNLKKKAGKSQTATTSATTNTKTPPPQSPRFNFNFSE